MRKIYKKHKLSQTASDSDSYVKLKCTYKKEIKKNKGKYGIKTHARPKVTQNYFSVTVHPQ